ncbi:ATP-binding protein [Lysinibacillus telephonicus]|uniref:ATP-binding protein n=1 Tax=Lysinibacillus telephonicus TaxID=1714840 RepID=UPI0031FBCB0E
MTYILVGALGTRKTHLASALGRRACEKGFEVRFYRVSHLLEVLETALSNGRLTSFRKKLEKVDVIILDEMGYDHLGRMVQSCSSKLSQGVYEQKSLITTSNL